MEKQSNRNKQFSEIHTFDRIFTKARGVHLFPEEKKNMLEMIERMSAGADQVSTIETKKDQGVLNN